MIKPKKAVANLLNSPLHAIVGLDLMATGLILLTNRRYFFWPPWPSWITTIENGIFIGLIGVVAGLGMIYWAISSKKSISLNRKLIPTASAYFTLLAVTEIMHGFFAPLGSPHMYTSGLSELIMTLITLYMARNSPTRNDRKGVVNINWKDILTKFLPLLPTLLMYWASYRLSTEKNFQEKKRDEFDRLNTENTRLSEDLDRYRKMVAAKEREIAKLQKEIAEMRRYTAGAPTTGALFDTEKEDKK